MGATKVYSLTSLSEASYADFQKARKSDGTYKKSEVIAALVKEGFSPTQAADFVEQWRVADHQPDTGSGFSVTLFDSDGQGWIEIEGKTLEGGLKVTEGLWQRPNAPHPPCGALHAGACA